MLQEPRVRMHPSAHDCEVSGSGGPVSESQTYYDEQPQADRPAKHESPSNPSPKHVAFELLLDESSKMRARIPMRVQIYPHDTTDSIVTTVKNFYGIYEGTASGVSFEDQDGNTLIARYENLKNSMTVYVRVIPNHHYPEQHSPPSYYAVSPMDNYSRPTLGEPFSMPPPQGNQATNYGQSASRPTSRAAAGKRSVSPPARGRRSASRQKSSRAGVKSRGSSTHGSFHDDAHMPCSDSDGGHSSVNGSRRPKSEHFGSADISMENILQDGRRKRPKFESSELPLFAPPQVPRTTSASSISPQRRSLAPDASPFARPNQNAFSGYQALASPQGFGYHEKLHSLQNGSGNNPYATPTVPHHGHRLRNRANSNSAVHYATPVNGHGILPTPDPTIASCISDEDVAMQLIRLGDTSNFSHGRNSTSTVDDAFSGIADAASSTGATTDMSDVSGDETDLPTKIRERRASSGSLQGLSKKHKTLDEILPSCESSDPASDDIDGEYQNLASQDNIKSEYDDDPSYEAQSSRTKRARKSASAATAAATSAKGTGAKQASTAKGGRNAKNRSAPASRKGKQAPTSSAKPVPPPLLPATAQQGGVNFHNQLAADEEDLSTKPRCQRCRKSKKGCDRQRPCQRCKDAGIGIEGCISEDENNGRKGRYGRHMGVSVKKDPSAIAAKAQEAQGTAAQTPASSTAAAVPDKNKKRKR
ncbi:C6 finger domain-containing protein [Trichophyton tonsurans CBS 112818]|uniref:C6 finger domain-containing protein n=1 Tax=Trichophyton tonsurans (strain CBS 112818) TaxID=647933 RepID=F2RZT9_TRIT1|nr:C6 finger domain-containing protein [Trichophyton tonsurans CBS 112818]